MYLKEKGMDHVHNFSLSGVVLFILWFPIKFVGELIERFCRKTEVAFNDPQQVILSTYQIF